MLKRKLKKDLVDSFNQLNNYQNDNYINDDYIQECKTTLIPSFDKGRYKRNCLMSFGVSFAVLLLITILSASFIVGETKRNYYEKYDQLVLTDDEVDYMEEKCDDNFKNPIYYISIDDSVYITLFKGYNENTNFYYIKLDTTESEVTVNINGDVSTFNSKGFYYVGCIDKGASIDRIDFILSNTEGSIVYTYYL